MWDKLAIIFCVGDMSDVGKKNGEETAGTITEKHSVKMINSVRSFYEFHF